jgi:hypothetical protein
MDNTAFSLKHQLCQRHNKFTASSVFNRPAATQHDRIDEAISGAFDVLNHLRQAGADRRLAGRRDQVGVVMLAGRMAQSAGDSLGCSDFGAAFLARPTPASVCPFPLIATAALL